PPKEVVYKVRRFDISAHLEVPFIGDRAGKDPAVEKVVRTCPRSDAEDCDMPLSEGRLTKAMILIEHSPAKEQAVVRVEIPVQQRRQAVILKGLPIVHIDIRIMTRTILYLAVRLYIR